MAAGVRRAGGAAKPRPAKKTAKVARPTPARPAADGAAAPAAGGFEGFPRGGGAFFEELAANQTREWFTEHKARYERLWQAPITALVDALAERLEPIFPGASQTKRKVFRIHRDVRFSADKSPYKTHAGAVLHLRPAAGPETASLVCYLHFEARSQFAGVGWYELPKVELERFRKAVAGPAGEALVRALAALEREGFRVGSRETLQRVPAGFPPDHPRAALLKRKGLFVELPPMPKGLLAKPALVDWIAAQVAETRPVVQWLEAQVARA